MTDFDALHDKAAGLTTDLSVITEIVDVLAVGVNAISIQGKPVDTTAPNDGDFLQWVAGSNEYQPVAGDPGGYAPVTRYEEGGADPLHHPGSPVFLTDLAAQTRVNLAADGSGLTLTDADGQARVNLVDSGMCLTITDAAAVVRVQLSDSGVLDLLAADGSAAAGLDPTALALFDAAFVTRARVDGTGSGIVLSDSSNMPRVSLVDDGSGLTLTDANGNVTVQVTYTTFATLDVDAHVRVEMNNGLIQMRDSAGLVRAQLWDDGTGLILTFDGVPRAQLKDDGTGLTLTDANGDPAAQFGETAFGVLGATPVGQQAFIPDATGGAIQDAEARAQLAALNALVIAFGFEAPS